MHYFFGMVKASFVSITQVRTCTVDVEGKFLAGLTHIPIGHTDEVGNDSSSGFLEQSLRRLILRIFLISYVTTPLLISYGNNFHCTSLLIFSACDSAGREQSRYAESAFPYSHQRRTPYFSRR